MPRIRSIKPEFWEDETVGTVSRDSRLLFIASWNLADDEGILRWNPAYIKSSVFMYDDDMDIDRCGALMRELEESGMIYAYTGGKVNQRLAKIVNFKKHQVVNRPSKTKLPPPAQLAFQSVNGSLNSSVSNSVNNSLTEGEGEWEGEQGTGNREGERASAAPPRPETFDRIESDVIPPQPEHNFSDQQRDQLIQKAAKLLCRSVNLNAIELAQWRPIAQMLLRDYQEADILQVLKGRIEHKARRGETYDFAFLATDVPKYLAKIRGSPRSGQTPLAAAAARTEALLNEIYPENTRPSDVRETP